MSEGAELTILHDGTNVVVWFIAAAILAFLLVYTKAGTDWRWTHNVVGRTLVALDLCILIMMVPGIAERVVNRQAFWTSTPWQLCELGVLFLVGIIILSRAIAFWRIMRRGRPAPQPPLVSAHTARSE